ncbi:hypothetical protein BJF79_42525 [Actinomadura sp. CNU-125]|nr:hypothetical protein BJF79_42525 [Actinomadura sp. CNU-125]
MVDGVPLVDGDGSSLGSGEVSGGGGDVVGESLGDDGGGVCPPGHGVPAGPPVGGAALDEGDEDGAAVPPRGR